MSLGDMPRETSEMDAYPRDARYRGCWSTNQLCQTEDFSRQVHPARNQPYMCGVFSAQPLGQLAHGFLLFALTCSCGYLDRAPTALTRSISSSCRNDSSAPWRIRATSTQSLDIFVRSSGARTSFTITAAIGGKEQLLELEPLMSTGNAQS